MKILAKKCSGKLEEVTKGLERLVSEEEKVEKIYGEIWLSAKMLKKDGKGYGYQKVGYIVGLEGKVREDMRRLFAMTGY